MKLYLFDFDGTISSKDSMIAYLKYINGAFFFLKAIGFIPVYLLYKVGILSNSFAKRILLHIFLFKFPQKYLKVKAREFATDFKKHLRKDAIRYIEKLKQDSSNKVVIVTASLDLWMIPLAELLSVDLICTKSFFENSSFKKFKTKNCYGEEKVRRIKSKFDLSSFKKIYAFGDSKGDEEMLKLAHQSYINKFQK